MLKLIIGNRTYSSWSLRGWLALKQSALPLDRKSTRLNSSHW